MASVVISHLNKNGGGGRRLSLDAVPVMEHATRALPAPEEWLHSELVEKRVDGSGETSWHPRQIVVTAARLYITRQESPDVIEDLPLAELENLQIHVAKDDNVLASIHRTKTIQTGTKDKHESIRAEKVGFQFTHIPGTGAALPASAHGGLPEGRKFIFATSSRELADEFLNVVKPAIKTARNNLRSPLWSRVVTRTKLIYDSNVVQGLVACIILGNFVVSILSAEVNPKETDPLYRRLEIADYCFTGLFTVELLVNLIANWFVAFWVDPWNIFDFIIVVISLLSIPLSDLPGFSMLRMMRVFRVVRLFKRLDSLRNVINALTRAIIPVANAFGVLAIVTSIYAVIGVSLYSGESALHDTFFGTFSTALFTMFQVCTGDSWSTAIARPMFGPNGNEQPIGSVAVFFVSYILIVGTFLLNVVVAVLLDEFISSVQSSKAEMSKARQDKRRRTGCLDPLLQSLASFESSRDLSEKIKTIYEVLDADDSGGLSYQEMREGFQRLATGQPVYMGPEDWQFMTEGGKLLDEEGELNAATFEDMIRRQLTLYVQRQAAFHFTETWEQNSALAAGAP